MRAPLAAVFVVFSSLLAAQEAPLSSAESSRDAQALFRRLDANGDGYLSAQELTAPAAIQGSWIAVDRDGDGRIAHDEFGIVRNFAATQPSSAAGGTQPPKDPGPKAEGRP